MPSGMVVATKAPNFSTSHSIQVIGYSPRRKVASKMMYSSRMNIGKAAQRLVTTASILSVMVCFFRTCPGV